MGWALLSLFVFVCCLAGPWIVAALRRRGS